ncbi:hypothetical protein EVJ58_g3678 [Rhodofomes roseus]|uniref:Uncharacterized protein n=1 Tax=Rhodofomes roseus TaxID=34475 RepID=A0A4Y9YJL6_9APHY|nr:hypothetical protein EVJ58_g3678 [Rhodofomes roseus]
MRMSWVDDPDDEYYVADDPNFYVDIADKLGDDLEAHTIMALHCQDTQLAHKVVMYYSNNSTVTLPFDLEDASNAKSDGCGSCVSELRNHILACAETSCPISAYVYYLGFLEQVFRKIAKTLHWLKGETGSVNHAVRSWRTEMEGCGSRNELHRAIIGAHSSAIYEDRREFPELAGSDVNIEVAENAAYQAYRRLGAVLPLYLRYSRRRNIPVLTLAFHGADVLARTSVKVAPRHTLQGESIPDDSRTSYTLFDILCSSIRVLTEDGLRALFIFNDVGCLRMQPEDDSTPSRYALSWSYGPGVSSKDMRAIRVQAIRERGRSMWVLLLVVFVFV